LSQSGGPLQIPHRAAAHLAVSPGFFHTGAFTKIEDAIRHHLNVYESARNYNPVAAGLPTDLTLLTGPIEPVLARLDPILRTPIDLNDQEFKDLVRFIKDGLQIPASSLKTCVSSLPHKSPVAWSLSSSRPAPTCAILTPTTATTNTIRTNGQ